MTFVQLAPKRFRLILVLIGYLLGLGVGSYFAWGVTEYMVYIALALLGLGFMVRSYWLGLVLLTLGSAVIGYSWAAYHVQKVTLPEPTTYHGLIQVTSVRWSGAPQQRVLATLLEGEYKGTSVQSYTYDFAYSPGTQLLVQTELQPSKYKSDRGRNVLGQANDLEVLEEAQPPSWLYAFRERLQLRMGATLPEPYASLAVGLLTGVNDNFDTNFKEDLQRTGTTHLVAVSGYNLTIVALLLRRLGQRKSRALGFALALASILFYIVLAGANPSILRGAAMAFLTLWATTAGRLTHRVPLILMSAALLSLITPLGMLYSLSWQLSFLAFAGIIFLHPVMSPLFQRALGNIGLSLSETLSAELLVLPLLLFRFGVLSVVAPLVNLFVLSFTPLAMALSAGQAIISLVSVPLGLLAAWITYPVLFLIVRPIQWSSELPFAAYPVEHFPFLYFGISYGLVGLLFLWLQRRVKGGLHES